MQRVLRGNLVLPDRVCMGSLEITDGVISSIVSEGPAVQDAPLILPGFVSVHFHGLMEFGMLDLDSLKGIAGCSPRTGVTAFLPTLASCSRTDERNFIENVKTLIRSHVTGARCLGSHLEGPYLSVAMKGGMAEEFLRLPKPEEIAEILELADGTLGMMTLAPELPGGLEAVRQLVQAGVTVSVGHSDCSPEIFFQAVDAGASHVCHLFDAYPGREVKEGIVQFSLADACLLDDRVTVELIVDGFHVQPQMVRLAVKTAGVSRIVGITDSLQGAGLPDGLYRQESGEEYYLDNNNFCRMTDPPYLIVGSSLTMLRAFRNMVQKFGYSVPEASRMLSANPARAVGAGDKTGALQEGLLADINILEGPEFQLQECLVAGRTEYRQ